MRTLERQWDALCGVLEREAARQEAVFAAVTEQAHAAHDRNPAALLAASERVQQLMREALQDEPERLAVVRELVEQYGLEAPEQTLTALIQHAPPHWQARLRALQQRLRGAVLASRAAVRELRPRLSQGLRFVEGALAQLFPQPIAGAHYSADGQTATRGARIAAGVINQRG